MLGPEVSTELKGAVPPEQMAKKMGEVFAESPPANQFFRLLQELKPIIDLDNKFKQMLVKMSEFMKEPRIFSSDEEIELDSIMKEIHEAIQGEGMGGSLDPKESGDYLLDRLKFLEEIIDEIRAKDNK